MSASGLVISQLQGVAVAELTVPSILEGPVIESIGEALYALVDEQACRKVIVDFSKVGFLASQMIGVLVALDNKARAIKGKVVLVGMRENLMKVFKITRLDKRLAFAADESEAMRALGVEPR